MPPTPPPVNYVWTNNTLTYFLDPIVGGVKIEYKKDGEEHFQLIFESSNYAPTSCVLNSILGPEGTVRGRTKKEGIEIWGPANEVVIMNHNTNPDTGETE